MRRSSSYSPEPYKKRNTTTESSSDKRSKLQSWRDRHSKPAPPPPLEHEYDRESRYSQPPSSSSSSNPFDTFFSSLEVPPEANNESMALSTSQLMSSSIELTPSQLDSFSTDSSELQDSNKPLKLPDFKKVAPKTFSTIDHSQIDYLTIVKNFYKESKEIAEMNEEEVEQLRREADNIRVTGSEIPKPIRSWFQSGLPQKIVDLLSSLGFSHPTPIQAQAIPALSSGRDVVGVAKTGSGKTLAFLLPLFRHVTLQTPLGRGDGPIGVVMAPTRELAMQTYHEAVRFGTPLGIRSVCLYGGSHVSEQIAELKRGCEVIICTPGRLIDMLTVNNGTVTNLFRVSFIVLDEADRMFDLGFEPQIKKIIENIRPDKQLVMFSATFPRPMEALAKNALTNPIRIMIGGRNQVCGDIQQVVIILPKIEKFDKLISLLTENTGKALVFVERQDSVGFLFKELISAGFSAGTLQGTMDQSDRDSTIVDFKNGVFSVLIATSLAARGLDVRDLNLVVNYDCPNHLEDYVHRVGRTGRAGRRGKAVTFLQPDEERFAPDLVRALRETGDELPSGLIEMAQRFMEKVKENQSLRKRSGFGGQGFKFDVEEAKAQKELRKKQRREAGLDVEESEEEDEEVVDVSALKDLSKLKSTTIEVADIDQSLSFEDRMNRVRKAAIEQSKLSALADVAAGKVGYYTEDYDINSYPQRARKLITSKEVVESLCSYCDVQIVVRGSHVPPGKEKLGHRGLHLAIESSKLSNIEMARKEISRILNESQSQMTGQELRQQKKTNIV
ncbi:hypothetical protein RCL1_002367 [Eukaryota sp. TZLM3-RCL]